MNRVRFGDLIRGLVPYLGHAYLSLVGATTRLRVRGQEHYRELRETNQRFIYALWHERQLFFIYSHRGVNAAILVSRSRDGELIARALELSGNHAVRGSSSRGAPAALLALIDSVQAGRDAGVTPDGPKGPRRAVKPGVLYLAQKLGVPILPMTSALSKKLVFKRSWDHFQVPLPFGRAVIAYGEPIRVGPGDDLALKAAELKGILDRLTDEADREVFA